MNPAEQARRGTAARRILLVTGRPEALRELADHLQELGYRLTVTAQPEDDPEADLFVVDATGPERWQQADALADGRMIVLLDRPADMRRAFDVGADDVVLLGAPVEEVGARCEAIIRRTASRPELAATPPAVYADRRLWINFDSRQVWVGGRPAQLTPREFRLLRVLIRKRDETLPHEELLDEVWGRAATRGRTPEVLKQYVWRLRQKIEPDPNAPSVIVTDPGEGYRFVSQGE